MRKILALAVVFLAAVLTSGTTALAQDSNPQLVAHVPFDFTVGQEQFTAGKYLVETIGESFILHSADGSKTAMFRTVDADEGAVAEHNQLEFRSENGTMALADVRVAGTTDGHEIVGGPGGGKAIAVLAVSLGR